MIKTPLAIVSLVLLAGVSILVVGYVISLGRTSNSESQMTESTETEVVDTVPVSSSISINLTEQNGSGEYGVATLSEEGGKVKVTLSMSGSPLGVIQPAHIHIGSCPEVGAVKYPLTFPENGNSDTLLDTTLDELRSQLPLAINVHKSSQEAKIYVACGDFAF